MHRQSWEKCEWFDHSYCPKNKDEIMIELKDDTSFRLGYDKSKGTEINKRFCHDCDEFKER